MNRTRALRTGRTRAPLLAALALACTSAHHPAEPIEGVASESLEVQATTRLIATNENPHSVQVAVVGRALVIDVVRTPAMCAPLISAEARRAREAIDVIVMLAENPLADCVPLDRYVLTYRATVPQVDPGHLTLRLFERVGDAPFVRRALRGVTVPP